LKFLPIVNHSLKYNPAIDGLRGVAIALVVLFHIWPDLFSFGYVGVDIFFVLSGFLITQIILIKLNSDTFSFKEFYRNRVRRIFPAMIVVVFTTLLIGYLLLLPSELSILGKHAKSSLWFFQNFRLIGETGYWDQSAHLKPLLHFWSLSVEEQFYLLWPLVLVLTYKLRFNMLWTLLAVSLLLSTLPTILELDRFYHSLARFWELAFGGLIYMLSTRYGINKFKYFIVTVFVLAIFLAYGNTEYSFFKTLMVVVSAGLLVLVLISDSKNYLFSSKILVFLGLISFPLYLWHYVLISYVHILNFDLSKYSFEVFFLSILLSYLTYRFVEIYFRNKSSYKVAYSLFCVIVLLSLIGQYFLATRGVPNRGHLEQKELFTQQYMKVEHNDDDGIALINRIMGTTPSNDYIRATSKELKNKYILIVGDSHALSSYLGFAQEFKKKGYETILLANSGCGPYIEKVENNLVDKSCQEKISSIHLLLKEVENIDNIEKIIFITRAPKLEHIEGLFKSFEKRNKELYYLLENPPLGFSPDICMKRPFDLSIVKQPCGIPYNKYIDMHSKYRSFAINEAKRYQNVQVLDPKDLYCDGEFCYAIKDGIVLYRDADHHSVNGSKAQAKYLVGRIFSNEN